MPRPCATCAGDLDLSLHDGEARCAHGDAVDRAFRALAWVEEERAAAEKRRDGGAPVNLQEAGEALDRAGKREGVSGSYVRALDKITKSLKSTDPDVAGKARALLAAVIARELRPDQAARELVKAGDADDPDTWLTPEEVLVPARHEAGGRFDLDPATIIRPDGTNPTDAREAYAKHRGDDGLALSWTLDREGRRVRTIWCNPPYNKGAIIEWVNRATETVRANPGMRIWMLIPSSTDTAYGQAALRAASAVCFLDDRVHHGKPDGEKQGSPKWGSMVVAFGAATCAHYAELGVVLPGGAAVKMLEAA